MLVQYSTTVGCWYGMIKYIMISNTALAWQQQNINHILNWVNSLKTRLSYGVSIVRIWEKIDPDKMYFQHCLMKLAPGFEKYCNTDIPSCTRNWCKAFPLKEYFPSFTLIWWNFHLAFIHILVVIITKFAHVKAAMLLWHEQKFVAALQ